MTAAKNVEGEVPNVSVDSLKKMLVPKMSRVKPKMSTVEKRKKRP